MMQKRVFFRVCIIGKIFSLLFWISPCSISALKSKTSIDISLGYVPHVQFTPFYVAQHLGYFDQEGINVYLKYGTSSDALLMLGQRKIDMALVDSDQFIFAREKGFPVEIVYQYYQQSPVSIFTIDPMIKTPKDLVGKRIGIPEFTGSSALGLWLFLVQNNLENKVTIVRIGYEQILSLKKRIVDAAVGYSNNEPIYFAEDNQKYTSWDVAHYFPLLAGPVLVVHRENFLSNKQLFANFSRALKRATIMIKENPIKMFNIVENILQINPSQRSIMRRVLMASIALTPEDSTPKPEMYRYTATKLQQFIRSNTISPYQ